ncbi:MAG: riboflavin biosynthesis protein RibF [Candidatus Zixiibacteriota bacterium]
MSEAYDSNRVNLSNDMHVCLDIRRVDFRAFEKPVVTLGSFDGVHRGHQTIIRRLIEKSQDKKRTGVVVTYEPHPQSVVSPHDAPGLLTTLEEKLFLFERLEVEEVVVMNFDEELKDYSAEEFVERILVGKFDLGSLVVGDDHAFGKRRSGGITLLRQMSSEYNFDLDTVPALLVNGSRVSSSRIRRELETGEFAQVTSWLGHGYPITGRVIRGKGRGKILGYPTLNLEVPSGKLLPQDGVYSVKARLDQGEYLGMMYVGPKPTFGDEDRSVEVHLFGLEGDAGGMKVALSVEGWIRAPISFPDAESLRIQLRSDETKVKQLFRIHCSY